MPYVKNPHTEYLDDAWSITETATDTVLAILDTETLADAVLEYLLGGVSPVKDYPVGVPISEPGATAAYQPDPDVYYRVVDDSGYVWLLPASTWPDECMVVGNCYTEDNCTWFDDILEGLQAKIFFTRSIASVEVLRKEPT